MKATVDLLSHLKDYGTANEIVRKRKKAALYYCWLLFGLIQFKFLYRAARGILSGDWAWHINEYKCIRRRTVLNRAVKHHLISADMKSSAQSNSNNPSWNFAPFSQEATSIRGSCCGRFRSGIRGGPCIVSSCGLRRFVPCPLTSH